MSPRGTGTFCTFSSKPPPVSAGRGQRLPAACGLSLKYPCSLCCSALLAEMVSEALFCLHRDHEGKGFKALPTPSPWLCCPGRGVPSSITLQPPPAAASVWSLCLGTGWDSCLPVLPHSQADGAGDHRSISLALSQVGSFPLALSGCHRAVDSLMLLLQDPIVPKVPLQPAASRSQTPADFRHRKRTFTFPTCKTLQQLLAPGNLGENCAAPAGKGLIFAVQDPLPSISCRAGPSGFFIAVFQGFAFPTGWKMPFWQPWL